MTSEQRRRVLLAPIGIWLALLLLLVVTGLYAVWPHAPAKTAMSLGIGIAKALLVAIFFMQLKSAAGLVRLAAIVGIVWLSFLFIFTFADLLTR